MIAKLELGLGALAAAALLGALGRARAGLEQAWGYQSYPSTRTVDTHIVQLRQKIDAALFETVRGVGYRLKAP